MAIQSRFLMILSIQMILPLMTKGQPRLSLNNDSLINSLKLLIENMNSNEAYKEAHFLVSDDYDYFASINSPRFAYEVIDVLTKIGLPFEPNQMSEITFVKCYEWTEANSTWFITLIDTNSNHYIYFYEANTGMDNPKMYGIKKGKDYFYSLAENLFNNSGCKDKNEDYIVTGRIIKSRFVCYFSSQTYHSKDIVFFNDLLKAISD